MTVTVQVCRSKGAHRHLSISTVYAVVRAIKMKFCSGPQGAKQGQVLVVVASAPDQATAGTTVT